MSDISLLIKSIAENSITSNLPDSSFRITIHIHGQTVEQLTDISLSRLRNRLPHRPHVNDIRPLIIGYPQTTERVLSDTLTEIAAQPLGSGKTGRHKGEAVVAHSTTAISGYPHEAAAVDKKLIDIVMG